MKGLILKDIYQIKLQLILIQFIGLFFYFMAFVVISIMLPAEMGSPMEDELNKMALVFFIGMMEFMAVSVNSSLLIDTSKLDIKSGWAKFERTTPLSGSQLVGGKIAATAIVIGILVFQALIFGVIAIFMGVNPEAVIALPLVFGCIQLIALTPVFPIVTRFGSFLANVLYIVFELMIVAVAIVIVFAHFSGDIDITVLRIIFYGVLPILTGLVVFASYKSGMKSIKSDI